MAMQLKKNFPDGLVAPVSRSSWRRKGRRFSAHRIFTPAPSTTSSIQKQIAPAPEPSLQSPPPAISSIQTRISLRPQCAPSDSHPARHKVRQTTETLFPKVVPIMRRNSPSEHQLHSHTAETQQQKIPPPPPAPISQPVAP